MTKMTLLLLLLLLLLSWSYLVFFSLLLMFSFVGNALYVIKRVLLSQNTTLFKLTTCFGFCTGPSSGHNIYN